MFLWKIPHDYAERLLGEYDRTSGIDRFEFKRGRPLEVEPDESPRFKFATTLSEIRDIHCLGNSALVPLVSPIVARILEESFSRDVQLIPAMVKCLDGTIQDYSVVVVTSLIRGLDHTHSRYKCAPGSNAIIRLDRAVYFDDCLGTHDAARDEEYLSNLLASDRLQGALNHLNGMGFFRVNE